MLLSFSMASGSEVMFRKKVDIPWSIYRVFTVSSKRTEALLMLKGLIIYKNAAVYYKEIKT